MHDLRPQKGHDQYFVPYRNFAMSAIVHAQIGPVEMFRMQLFQDRLALDFAISATRGASGFDLCLEGSIHAVPMDVLAPLLALFVRVLYRRNGARPAHIDLPRSFATEPWFSSVRLQAINASRVRYVMDEHLLDSNRDGRVSNDVYSDTTGIHWNVVPLDTDITSVLCSRIERGAILEIGSGSGRNAISLENAGYYVYGIEQSEIAVETCRRHVQMPGNFVVGDILEMPKEFTAFDAVLDVGCLHMLGGTAEKTRALSACQRCMAPNAIFASRFFKPKDAVWLERQPFKAVEFGCELEPAIKLYAQFFEIEDAWETEGLGYIIGRNRS